MTNKKTLIAMSLTLAGVLAGPAYALNYNKENGNDTRKREELNITTSSNLKYSKPDKNSNQGDFFDYKGTTYKLERIKMELINERDLIDISAKQMNKDEAISTCKPYRFTIKNSGNVNFDANLYLGVTNNTLGVKPDDVRVYIEDNYGNTILDGTFADTENLLKKNIRVSRYMERSFKMWSWVDTPVNVDDGSFEFKVGAFATQERK